jgi:hypothetical protein
LNASVAGNTVNGGIPAPIGTIDTEMGDQVPDGPLIAGAEGALALLGIVYAQ